MIANDRDEDIPLDLALRRLGFFVTEEDPVLWRSAPGGGCVLLVHFSEGVSPLSTGTEVSLILGA